MKKKNSKKINNKTKIIIAIIIVTIIIILIGLRLFRYNKIGQYYKKIGWDISENISEKLKEDKKIDNITVSNMKIIETQGKYTVTGKIINTEAIENYMIQINIVDKEGNVLSTIRKKIENLQSGEETEIGILITDDLSDAYDIEISKF